ncbi:MAG TPA: hypothetical protein VH062_28735 [Polyangiaceae bacterium]|jgi:hypothetical protein|nr:hypothetical protein [Polyangiaceae bacterium]
MNIEKLFNVLVVTGASSTVGLLGCSADVHGLGNDDAGTGGAETGGKPSSGGADAGTGGASSGGAAGAAGAAGSESDSGMCSCKPSSVTPTWTDCDGCCCWLPVGATTTIGSQICGETPCCIGKGR